jgi:hypothetical protein
LNRKIKSAQVAGRMGALSCLCDAVEVKVNLRELRLRVCTEFSWLTGFWERGDGS